MLAKLAARLRSADRLPARLTNLSFQLQPWQGGRFPFNSDKITVITDATSS
jgi:hypothetical protein